jgi:hypothetical protein
VEEMVYLETVCNEVENKREQFLEECKHSLPELKEKFGLTSTLEEIRAELANFLKNKCPFSNVEIKNKKKEVRKEIIQLKHIKIGDGDFEIICQSRLHNLTVITHDENLFSLLINHAKTLFLIEFIIENKDKLSDIEPQSVSYLWYGCLPRYNLALNELRQKFGIIAGNNLHLRRLRILNYLEDVLPLQNKTIIPTTF